MMYDEYNEMDEGVIPEELEIADEDIDEEEMI